MKLVRLLRLGRILRMMKFKQGFKLSMRLIQLLMGLIFIVHWLTCIWYIVIKIKNDWIPPKYLALANPGMPLS